MVGVSQGVEPTEDLGSEGGHLPREAASWRPPQRPKDGGVYTASAERQVCAGSLAADGNPARKSWCRGGGGVGG